jgi:hypothetical protein
MILALALAAQAATGAPSPAPVTAIDAERAFIADAHTIGQWVAFRKWSSEDAVLFGPQPENAHAALKDAPEPKVAIFWWPGQSFVSCDGNLAVNTGPWVRGGGKKVGFFTTVWRRKDGEWRWIYDGGGDLDTPRAEGGDIKPVVATCPRLPVPPPPQHEMPADVKWQTGSSKDGTLNWFWAVSPDGSRTFTTMIWDGRQHKVVIADKIAAPPK